MNAPADPQYQDCIRKSFARQVARGQMVKSGRTLTVARAEVYADDGTHVATMQQTLVMLPNTPDSPE